MNFAIGYIGKTGFAVLIGLILAVSTAAFLFLIFKNSPGFIKGSILVILAISGLAITWYIKIPEEKIHILEYAILGWFAARDFTIKNRKAKGFALSFLFCIAVGFFDEIFQAVLPYRFFQWRDIAFNSLGGFWGVSLYSLS